MSSSTTALILGFAGLCTVMRVMPQLAPRVIIIVLLASAVLVGVLVSLPIANAAWFGPAVFWSIAGVFALMRRGSMGRWRADAAANAIVLDAPFVGAWTAAAGGADPKRNHHLVASDQRFAYDFVREDDASFGSPILAPVDGTVVFAHDGMDDQPEQRRVHETRPAFGNCVAIGTSQGTIFLCHLQRGSVRVSVGDVVESGQQVGICGNSGRTTRSHLHIHAQREAEPAPFEGTGVPIAFRVGGVPRVLMPDDVLGETPVLVTR